jgi:hypothetical protein
MDKILSAEEFKQEQYSDVYWDENSAMEFAKDFSNYLLEAFASEVIDASNVSYVNETIIEQILTKFKKNL